MTMKHFILIYSQMIDQRHEEFEKDGGGPLK